ncbi:MAG TPA: maleylpyruvate isomerase family mycothiol-dependent enzyme [Acidimicrobiales bacterium]|nr:maleylpyruvate isomerase family mycothiol-dependent enzyme [Acidimicrobiales bacterium]
MPATTAAMPATSAAGHRRFRIVDMDTADLGALYEDTRARLAALVSTLDDDQLAAPVPACPGWTVADVVAHLAAVVEDVLAGRLTGPPSAEETAAQVARFRGLPPQEILERWEAGAAAFAGLINAARVWPGVIDIVSHEHDIRAAVGEPGARDSAAVRASAEVLLRGLAPPVPLRIECEGRSVTLGPAEGEALTLTTTSFDTLRWRMGRRSRRQLAALDWSGDPEPVLDHLVVFGPAAEDIVE